MKKYFVASLSREGEVYNFITIAAGTNSEELTVHIGGDEGITLYETEIVFIYEQIALFRRLSGAKPWTN